MLEYASENSVIKILPERVHFAFEKNDLGSTMKRNVKVYNKAPGPIKINILSSETEIFTFKHKCLTKLVPGIPLTVTIEFKPTKETEYTDWLRISCQNDSSITLPVFAVPYAEKTTRITDAEFENTFSDNRPSQCLVVNGNKNIKHVRHKKRYRKLVRFQIDSNVTSNKGKHRNVVNSKSLKKFTQHDVNITLMENPLKISDPDQQLGPYGLLRNEYLERRKIHENVFFDEVRDIQLQDSSAERNPNVVRLFKQEVSSEEVEEVEVYRSLQEMKYEESATGNEGTYPIYLRQKLITKCDQVVHWEPPKNTPDIWIFRYEALWKFIQLARSIIIYNRLVKIMEKLKKAV